MITLRLVTNKGLEDIAAAEFIQKAKLFELSIQMVRIKPWKLEGIILIVVNHSIEKIERVGESQNIET